MGAKNTETKNASPVNIAVIPVLPPSGTSLSQPTRHTIRKMGGVLTTDTSGAFDVRRNGACPHERAHADREGVHTVRNSGVLKVECHGIAQTCKLGHGVERPGEG